MCSNNVSKDGCLATVAKRLFLSLVTVKLLLEYLLRYRLISSGKLSSISFGI